MNDEPASRTARIGVVVPTHDDGRLVAEAVASIHEQEAVEVVVVDDGSTDPGSLARLQELRLRGVRVIRQANAGPAAARNTGIAAMSAPLVLALDADDMLEPGMLSRLADLLDARPEAAVAWGDYVEFGDRERRSHAPVSLLPWSTTYVNLYSPSCLVRREALETIGGWPEIGYEDWGLFVAFVDAEMSGVHVGDVVYRRRVHGSTRLRVLRREHGRLYAELRGHYAGAFAQRARWARLERPPLWKRLAYPLLFGRRLLLPAVLEDLLRQSRLWNRIRRLRR